MKLHERLGHPSFDAVSNILNKENIQYKKTKNPSCDFCEAGKLNRLSFPKQISLCTKKLELVHSDLCGPITPTSFGCNILCNFLKNKTSFEYICKFQKR